MKSFVLAISMLLICMAMQAQYDNGTMDLKMMNPSEIGGVMDPNGNIGLLYIKSSGGYLQMLDRDLNTLKVQSLNFTMPERTYFLGTYVSEERMVFYFYETFGYEEKIYTWTLNPGNGTILKKSDIALLNRKKERLLFHFNHNNQLTFVLSNKARTELIIREITDLAEFNDIRIPANATLVKSLAKRSRFIDPTRSTSLASAWYKRKVYQPDTESLYITLDNVGGKVASNTKVVKLDYKTKTVTENNFRSTVSDFKGQRNSFLFDGYLFKLNMVRSAFTLEVFEVETGKLVKKIDRGGTQSFPFMVTRFIFQNPWGTEYPIRMLERNVNEVIPRMKGQGGMGILSNPFGNLMNKMDASLVVQKDRGGDYLIDVGFVYTGDMSVYNESEGWFGLQGEEIQRNESIATGMELYGMHNFYEYGNRNISFVRGVVSLEREETRVGQGSKMIDQVNRIKRQMISEKRRIATTGLIFGAENAYLIFVERGSLEAQLVKLQ